MEAEILIKNLQVTSQVMSDHYTNYLHVSGQLPDDRERMLHVIELALDQDETSFREVYIGTE